MTTYAPWAVRAGALASDLMCVPYEEVFAEDVSARAGSAEEARPRESRFLPPSPIPFLLQLASILLPFFA